LNEKEGLSSSKYVSDNGVTSVGLPEIPCAWCDYKHTIEFDLGNHLLANHREQLLKLPIGKDSMDIRIDYAIQHTKREMAAQYDDEDKDAAEENDSDDVE
jgi:hypothetical protein